MATAAPQLLADEKSKKDSHIKQEITSDEEQLDIKSEAWEPIVSVEYPMLDLEDFNNSKVKQELGDVPEYESRAELKQKLKDLSQQNVENGRNSEELQENDNDKFCVKLLVTTEKTVCDEALKNDKKPNIYIKEEIEEENMVRQTSCKLKSINLPLGQKIDILKELGKGWPVSQLAQKYGIAIRTIYDIQKRKDKILNYAQNSIEKGEEDNLKRSALPNSAPVCLPLLKKVKILEELKKGESVIELTKKYGVCKNTIYEIRKGNDKLLSYVKKSIENGDEDKLKRTTLPKSKPVTLPIGKRAKILEELDRGEPVIQLIEKYGVSRRTIYDIRKGKAKLLSFVQKSIEEGDEDKLNLAALPKSKPITLPFLKRVEILEKLEKGEPVKQLMEKYGVCKSTIYQMQKQKDKILNYVRNSIEKGDADKLKRTTLPYSKPVTLPLSKRATILGELEKGESISELAEKYGVCKTTIYKIQNQKDKILNYVLNSVKEGDEYKLNLAALPKTKPVTLPFSKRVEILEKLEKGEPVKKLMEMYGVCKSTVYQIHKQKDKILSYVQNSVEKGDVDKLKRAALPTSYSIPLSKRVSILEELEKGESISELAEKYGVCRRSIYKIQEQKDKLLNYVQKSIERGEEENLKRTMLPKSRTVSFPLSEEVISLSRSVVEAADTHDGFLDLSETLQVEIEEWNNYAVKEEPIDFSDDEAMEDTNYSNELIDNLDQKDSVLTRSEAPTWDQKRVKLENDRTTPSDL